MAAPAGRLELVGLKLTPIRLRLRSPLKMSIATVPERECVLVEAQTAEGITGLGESVLAPYFTGENVTGAMRAISRSLAPALIGRDIFDLAGAAVAMDRVLYGNQAAKSAVETALHDAAARALGIPLHQLLGGRVRDGVPATWHVVGSSPEEVAEECQHGLAMGFRAIKLKVGSLSVAADLERLDSVRRIVGDDVEIRPDANQAWALADAARFLAGARDHRLQFVEQPLHRDDLAGMAHLASGTQTPIAPDEGVFGAEGALAYIRAGAAGGFVPKLIKAGGIGGVRRLAAVADAAHLALHLAGMPGESSVCAAAAVHLGVALPNLAWGGGISPHAIEHDLVRGPLQLIDGAYLPPAGAGLGVDLDPRLVARARLEI